MALVALHINAAITSNQGNPITTLELSKTLIVRTVFVVQCLSQVEFFGSLAKVFLGKLD